MRGLDGAWIYKSFIAAAASSRFAKHYIPSSKEHFEIVRSQALFLKFVNLDDATTANNDCRHAEED